MITYVKLAHRAVACRAWRWLPGVLTAPFGTPRRFIQYDADGKFVFVSIDRHSRVTLHPHSYLLPDLSDPATIGCLWALVSEALDFHSNIKVEALVAALEAAL